MTYHLVMDIYRYFDDFNIQLAKSDTIRCFTAEYAEYFYMLYIHAFAYAEVISNERRTNNASFSLARPQEGQKCKRVAE